ncbi:MAG: hypothetical protein NZM10_04305 [Fimbriimonadales bacterium]|nr:hypothetical protein [Fimbriimonadales bacterium]
MSARLVVIGWLFWLGLSAACGQSQPSSSSWQSGFRLFLMSPSSAGAGGAPRVSRVNRSSVVYTPRRASRPAAAPARPAELRTDTGQQIDCDAFIRNGRT